MASEHQLTISNRECAELLVEEVKLTLTCLIHIPPTSQLVKTQTKPPSIQSRQFTSLPWGWTPIMTKTLPQGKRHKISFTILTVLAIITR